jgi:phosphoribosylformylglycinamidine (FGAM) synthase-like enzyme
MILKGDSFYLREQLLKEINLSIDIDESLIERETNWSPLIEQPLPLPEEHFLSWDLDCLLERIMPKDANELQMITKIQATEPIPYYAVLKAVDEMICSKVSMGRDLQQIEILAHFCQLENLKNAYDKQQMQHFLYAVAGLADISAHLELPLKYSHQALIRYEQPCWLLVSAVSLINNSSVNNFKNPGDWVYIIGLTKNELGRSEYSLMKEVAGGIFPKTNLSETKHFCQIIHQCIQKKLVSSCHSCNKGGLGIALLRMATSGVDHGIKIDLNTVPIESVHTDAELLFSESSSRFIVTVPPSLAKEFEESILTCPFGRIGVVTGDNEIIVTGLHGDTIIRFTDMLKANETAMRGI